MDFEYIKTKQGDALAISLIKEEKKIWSDILDRAELLRPLGENWNKNFKENLEELRDSLWDDENGRKLLFGNRLLPATILMYDLLLDNYLVNREVDKKILESQIQENESRLRSLQMTCRAAELEKGILDDIRTENKYRAVDEYTTYTDEKGNIMITKAENHFRR